MLWAARGLLNLLSANTLQENVFYYLCTVNKDYSDWK